MQTPAQVREVGEGRRRSPGGLLCWAQAPGGGRGGQPPCWGRALRAPHLAGAWTEPAAAVGAGLLPPPQLAQPRPSPTAPGPGRPQSGDRDRPWTPGNLLPVTSQPDQASWEQRRTGTLCPETRSPRWPTPTPCGPPVASAGPSPLWASKYKACCFLRFSPDGCSSERPPSLPGPHRGLPGDAPQDCTADPRAGLRLTLGRRRSAPARAGCAPEAFCLPGAPDESRRLPAGPRRTWHGSPGHRCAFWGHAVWLRPGGLLQPLLRVAPGIPPGLRAGGEDPLSFL